MQWHMDESQRHNNEKKKLDTEEYYFIYMIQR